MSGPQVSAQTANPHPKLLQAQGLSVASLLLLANGSLLQPCLGVDLCLSNHLSLGFCWSPRDASGNQVQVLTTWKLFIPSHPRPWGISFQ